MSGRDHPRLRGEHMNTNITNALSPGSPPPTRGTHEQRQLIMKEYRITPAYAGNTIEIVSKFNSSWDHPRLRGEHLTLRTIRNLIRGSPPPTRGTQLKRCKIGLYGGITPAYAGNTSPLEIAKFESEDHPRLRGEHQKCYDVEEIEIGSPPPTRGTHFLAAYLKLCGRITPAYAGNTVIRSLKQAMSDYINP